MMDLERGGEKMKVDFNNLRKKTADKFNRIIKLMKEENYNDTVISEKLDNRQKNAIEDLRSCIVGLVCVYEEGNDDFKEINVDIDFIETEEDF